MLKAWNVDLQPSGGGATAWKVMSIQDKGKLYTISCMQIVGEGGIPSVTSQTLG